MVVSIFYLHSLLVAVTQQLELACRIAEMNESGFLHSRVDLAYHAEN